MKIPEHIRKLDDDDAEYTVDDELDFMGGQIRMLCHVIVQMVHSNLGAWSSQQSAVENRIIIAETLDRLADKTSVSPVLSNKSVRRQQGGYDVLKQLTGSAEELRKDAIKMLREEADRIESGKSVGASLIKNWVERDDPEK